jgi:hypothetical protein
VIAARNRPKKTEESKSKSTDPTSAAEEVLTHAQSGRKVIKDFCPLAESLEWELGQQYLRDRGNKSFISDASPVPFVINDGTLSHNAAQIFFASLTAAEAKGQLTRDEDIFVLELGIGVGLFARFFLDAFRDLCWQENKDYYDRLCYIAAARNESLHHAGRDWVFWMDADDRLDGDNRDKLRSLFGTLNGDNAAYVMKCHCLPDPITKTATVVDHVRLFRNLPGLRWRYRVHEQILPAVRQRGGERGPGSERAGARVPGVARLLLLVGPTSRYHRMTWESLSFLV